MKENWDKDGLLLTDESPHPLTFLGYSAMKVRIR